MRSPTQRAAAWLVLSALFVLLVPRSAAPALAAQAAPPTNVSIPGSYQSEAGCDGDWAPDCAKTQLAYDKGTDLWTGTFTIPAGNYEYKAAINNSWTENYGLHAVNGGPNIPLALAADGPVKFYYDHKTHWVADN